MLCDSSETSRSGIKTENWKQSKFSSMYGRRNRINEMRKCKKKVNLCYIRFPVSRYLISNSVSDGPMNLET